MDLFRTESILLKTHWILVIMDHNGLRVHQGLDGAPPDEKAGSPSLKQASLEGYAWRSHYHGLFDLPIAA